MHDIVSIPKTDEEQYYDALTSFKTKLQALLIEYYPAFNKNIDELFWNTLKLVIEIVDQNGKIKITDEYRPEYCSLMLKYAQVNVNPEGFYGEYKIDVTCKEKWAKEHEEWRKTLLLIPQVTANLLNKNFEKIINAINQSNPSLDVLKLSSQLTMKWMDLQYRTNKDSGEVKDDKRTRDQIKKTNQEVINPSEYINLDAFDIGGK